MITITEAKKIINNLDVKAIKKELVEFSLKTRMENNTFLSKAVLDLELGAIVYAYNNSYDKDKCIDLCGVKVIEFYKEENLLDSIERGFYNYLLEQGTDKAKAMRITEEKFKIDMLDRYYNYCKEIAPLYIEIEPNLEDKIDDFYNTVI